MKRMRPQRLALLIVALATLGGCASAPQAAPPDPVTHVVVVWLKQPGDEGARQRIIDVSRSLKALPGVVRITAGRAIPSERTQVDDSFDVAVVMTFRDRRALAEYGEHPDHKQAVRDVLAPLAERVLIYDVEE